MRLGLPAQVRQTWPMPQTLLRSRSAAVGCAVLIVLGTLAAAGPATASSTARVDPVPAAGPATASIAADPVLAGYRVAVETTATSSIETHVRLPRVPKDDRCDDAPTAMRTVVEIAGADGGVVSLELTGRCTAGDRVTYAMHASPAGKAREPVDQPYRPGDTVAVRMIESDGINELSITNVERGWTELYLGQAITVEGLEVGVRAVGGQALPTFEPVRFGATSVDGVPLDALDVERVRCVGEDGVRAVPSPLRDGGAFAVRNRGA